MTTLTNSQTAPSDASTQSAASFSICVSEPNVDERIVELHPGKSTVGSSDRCQVHVTDPATRPLHCLIVREGGSVTVTRWAAGVLLNGSDFATSEFNPGDCLQIGQTQISLVASVATEFDKEPSHNQSVPGIQNFEVPASSFAPQEPLRQEHSVDVDTNIETSASQNQAKQLIARLQSTKENTRARCRKLIAVLRSMRQEARGFDLKVEDLERQLNLAQEERDQIVAQLSQLRVESSEREQTTTQEIDRLIAELSAAYEKATAAETALQQADLNANQHQSELSKQLEEAREQGERSNASIVELERQVSEAHEQVSQSTASIVELERQLEEVSKRAEDASNTNHELEQQLSSAREEFTDASARIVELEQQYESVNEQATVSSASNAELENQLTEAKTQVDSTSARVDELEQQISQANVQLEETKSSIADLEQQIELKQSELSCSNESVTQLELQLQDVLTELTELNGEKEQWEQLRSAGELQRTKLAQAVADKERSVETLQSELEQFRHAADQADESRMEQATAMQGLQAELELLQAEREQLVSEQASAQQYQAELEQTLADSEQNLAVFQLELEKFQLTSRQTEQELADKTAELQEWQTEGVGIREERDQLVSKRTEYQLREQGWEHEITTRDAKIEELNGEIASLRDSVEDAVQGVATHTSQLEESKQQLDAITIERDELLSAQTEHAQTLKAWEEAVEARDRHIAELEQEHEGICEVLQSVEKGAFQQVDTCNKLQEQLSEVREERDQIANALPEQQAYIQKLEETLAERDGQLNLISDELTRTSESRAELEAKIASGEGAHQAFQAELKTINARCEELQQSHDASQQEKRSAEQALDASQQQIAELTDQIEADQQRRQELEQIVADGSQSSEAIQAELNALRIRYEQLTQEHQSETDRREELATQLADREQNLELFQVDLQSVQAELQRTAAQAAELTTERDTLNSQLVGLRDELDSRESDESSSVGQLQQERDQLAVELASVQSELEASRSQVERQADQEPAVSQLQQERDEFANELESLRVQLQSAHTELESSTAAESLVTQLQQDRNQLADQLESVKSQLAEAQYEIEKLATAEPTPSAIEVEPQAEESTTDWPEPALGESTTVDYHDAYASDDNDDIADQYSCESQLTDEQPVAVVESPDGVTWDVSVESPAVLDDEKSLLAADAFSDQQTWEEAAPADEVDQAQFSDDIEHPTQAAVTEDSGIVLEGEVATCSTSAFDMPAEPAEEEPAKEFQPTSFIDQYQHLLEDDNSDHFEPMESTPAPVENRLGAELDAGHEDDSDEALQAYMQNMMRRVRGDSSDEEVSAPQPREEVKINQAPNPVSAVNQVLQNVAPQPEVADETPESSEPIDLEALKKSSEKPALPTDLAAMRELANSSARKAIAKHHKRRHLEKAAGMFLVCVVMILVGAYMLITGAATQNFLGFEFLGGAIASVIGAVGGCKLLKQLMLAIRAGSWEKTRAKATAKKSEANAKSENESSSR